MQMVLEEVNQPKEKFLDEKYLAFLIDGVIYGIPIRFVTEIIEVLTITPVPNSPFFIKGIINLRGKLIPTMDLRLRLGMQEKEYNEKTCIIIVNLNRNQNEQIGLIIDMVSEVFDIPESEMDYSLGCKFMGNENFLDGIGKVNDKAVMILNIFSILKIE